MSQADRIETLSASERWLADARQVADAPGGYMQRAVDMAEALRWLRSLREVGIEANVAHLLVHAAALALGHHPDLHQIVHGYERHHPGVVDIAVSIADETGAATTQAPVVVGGADRRSLGQLVEAMDAALVRGARREVKTGALASWWMALAPFAFLRRWLLRGIQRAPWFRRRVAGTFHISVAPQADALVPLRLKTGAALGAGRVRDVVVSTQGQLEVRPTMTLTLVVDHVVLDGVRAAQLLNEIAAVLESGGESLARLPEPPSPDAALLS